MKLNGVIYPYNIEARKLPIHLTGIGGTDWQQPISRPIGYEWHQIIISESGEGTLGYDNIFQTVRAGECFFLPAGYPHEYRPIEEKWKVRFITFDGCSASHILSVLGMTKPVIINTNGDGRLIELFERMYYAQTQDRLYGDFICSGLTYEFILEFRRYMSDRSNKGQNERSQMIAAVLDYIDGHYAENFALTELSAAAGISPQHLCRVFREAMNMRPKEYITRVRLREAKRLLQETKMTVAEIAQKTGFADTAYFCSVFRKNEKVSPLEYRARTGV